MLISFLSQSRRQLVINKTWFKLKTREVDHLKSLWNKKNNTSNMTQKKIIPSLRPLEWLLSSKPCLININLIQVSSKVILIYWFSNKKKMYPCHNNWIICLHHHQFSKLYSLSRNTKNHLSMLFVIINLIWKRLSRL